MFKPVVSEVEVASLVLHVESGPDVVSLRGSGDGQHYFLVRGEELQLLADGGEVALPELLAWFVRSPGPVRARLEQRVDRYMAVTRAEFTRQVVETQEHT